MTYIELFRGVLLAPDSSRVDPELARSSFQIAILTAERVSECREQRGQGQRAEGREPEPLQPKLMHVVYGLSLSHLFSQLDFLTAS
jgi:hypothetical protein